MIRPLPPLPPGGLCARRGAEYHHGSLPGLVPLLENVLHPNAIYDRQNKGS